MYRSILITTFLGLLVLTLSAAGVAWHGSNQARYELERTRLANEVLEAHIRLRSKTYMLFKQLTDTFLTQGASKLDEAAARKRLLNQIDAVRTAIAREVSFLGDEEDETEELDRLAAIERQIQSVLEKLRAAEAVLAQGGTLRDVPFLEDVLERSIDREFEPLIDAAIAEEHRELAAAHEGARETLLRVRTLSQAVLALSVPLSLLALFFLVTRLRRPLDQLAKGAGAVAAGDLGHRVPVSGRDEFARVAETFNHMVEELSRSRSEVEQAKRGLEGAIAERTAELEGANATLKRADEVRRRFLADISHELRTPLTIMRGEAEVTLRNREAPVEDYRTALGRVADQAVQTTRLVDDLLFVARAESGEPRLSLRPVAFEQVVRRACADAEVLADAKDVRILLDENADKPVVQGDPDKLRQLVMILIDNALRYSQEAGLIEVSLVPGVKGVVLRVADRGAGIAEDELGRVFERFYRGENAASQHPGGSGLGLPLAKAIVDAHGGEIALSSRLGEGTTVTVSLPTVRRLRMIAA